MLLIPVLFQSVSTFDAEVYEELQEDAKKLVAGYEKKACEAGVGDVVTVVELEILKLY